VSFQVVFVRISTHFCVFVVAKEHLRGNPRVFCIKGSGLTGACWLRQDCVVYGKNERN
jgi:hypothetical protein